MASNRLSGSNCDGGNQRRAADRLELQTQAPVANANAERRFRGPEGAARRLSGTPRFQFPATVREDIERARLRESLDRLERVHGDIPGAVRKRNVVGEAALAIAFIERGIFGADNSLGL